MDSKRKNFLIGGLLACVMIFFASYFFSAYVSLRGEILEMHSETQRLRLTEKNLDDFLERQKKFPDLLEVSEENFFATRDFLPAESEQEKFTDEIYLAAEKNNISINSLQVGEPFPLEAGKNFYRQSVQVQLEANYISLLNFLREISDGKRFVTLASISIDSAEGKLSCDMNFLIYSANLSEETPKP